MKYLAKSISDHIISELNQLLTRTTTENREIRIILPSFPGSVVLDIGTAIEEYCFNKKE